MKIIAFQEKTLKLNYKLF